MTRPSLSSLRLSVAQQLRHSVGTVVTLELQEPSLLLDDTSLRDFVGTATLMRTGRGLLVTIHATATVQEHCARCLVELVCPIQIDLQEEYIPLVDPLTGAPVDVDDTDSFRIGRDFVLDLREGLRQYTLISEPAKPLCKADCVGLCPECGADLNLGPCRCPPHPDERWQRLADLEIETGEGGS